MPCIEQPASDRYVRTLRGRIQRRWNPSWGTARLEFALDEWGTPSSVNVNALSQPGLGVTALETLRDAQPFPEIPSDAHCLIGLPIQVLLGTTRRPSSASNWCLPTDETSLYLDIAKKKVMLSWEIPADVDPGQESVVLFRVRPNGEIYLIRLAAGTHPSMNLSVLRALHQASPLPPLTDASSCLADLSIRLRFSNPASPGEEQQPNIEAIGTSSPNEPAP